jgi:hypothetical protein
MGWCIADRRYAEAALAREFAGLVEGACGAVAEEVITVSV